MKFACIKCNYVAQRQELPPKCPYCGEPGSMRKAKDAQDLLDELIDEDRNLT